MKNMKIRRKLIFSFMIVNVMTLLVGIISFWGMNSLKKADEVLYKHNLLSIKSICNICENLQEQRVFLRDYIIYSENDIKINSIDSKLVDLDRKIAELFNEYEASITDESLETDYYKSKSIYLNDFAVIKENAKNASKIGYDASMERLEAPETASTVSELMNGFITAMDINIKGANETVIQNESLYNAMVIFLIAYIIVSIGISTILAIYISGMISKPLMLMTEYLEIVANTGDMTLRESDVINIEKFSKIKDETGILVSSTAFFVNRMLKISKALETVAEGDLTVNVSLQSEKDTMGLSLRKMTNNLNKMFEGINRATEQVASGSKQISDGAQGLAQGTTEQASAVEQLSSSISEIEKMTQDNTEMVQKASKLAVTIKQNAEKGNSRMDQMLVAVKEIQEASQSISSVIKVIDDIAFQTNILALNAAVEAARAGQLGKGFAVVADEVRNLASKSAEAAKNTSGLIVNSMEKAELGARIAGETAVSLSDIVEGIKESTEIVGNIAKSSENQLISITQINSGIDQVAQVIQQNSAASQQSASASAEMSDQALMLEEMVSQFKINK